jgi:hypothetical protein
MSLLKPLLLRIMVTSFPPPLSQKKIITPRFTQNTELPTMANDMSLNCVHLQCLFMLLAALLFLLLRLSEFTYSLTINSRTGMNELIVSCYVTVSDTWSWRNFRSNYGNGSDLWMTWSCNIIVYKQGNSESRSGQGLVIAYQKLHKSQGRKPRA